MSTNTMTNSTGTQNGQQAAQPERYEVREGDTFAGNVEDWSLAESKHGYPQLRVVVRLSSMLLNPKSPEAGTKPVPNGVSPTATVFVTFGNQNDMARALENSARDLKTLGVGYLSPRQLDRLNPAHPDRIDLKGRPVHVKKSAGAYWNLIGFGQKSFEEKPVTKESLKKFSEEIGDAWDEALAKSGLSRQQSTSPRAGDTSPAGAQVNNDLEYTGY